MREALEVYTDLGGRLNDTLDTLDIAAETFIHEADNLEHSVREGLESMTETLESVRILAEDLQKNPASLIRGKRKPKD